MREILYRGKRVDNGEWIYGSLIDMDGQTAQIFISKRFPHASSFTNQQLTAMNMKLVHRETVGLGTGLSDKNFVPIFEGDIISLVNADGERIEVVCEFGTARREIFENTVDIVGFYFRLPDGRKTYPIVCNYLGKHDLELFEVVGTVHDRGKRSVL